MALVTKRGAPRVRCIFAEALAAIFVIGLFPCLAVAKPLQIIHTNDLHSHFEHADDDAVGGYAYVKGVIEELKGRAASNGIETIVLDAGDFSEGTPFFMADQGLWSWKMMNDMGYDAVTLGNHDWLIGLPQMDELMGRLKPNVPFLGANFKFGGWYKNLANHVLPYIETSRSGAKIAILGLTTDDFLYRWRVRDGTVNPPKTVAREIVPRLRRHNDFVIALTHLGVEADKKLVRNTEGIDLIVGGHSHTALTEVVTEKDLNHKSVAIVQAGAHGEFVGDLLVDIERGRPLKILHYQLIPVTQAAGSPQDQEMAQNVARARAELELRYGYDWFHEELTISDVPLERPLTHATRWGNFYADVMREAIQADISFDVGEFFGGTQARGPVTREDLFKFYPRVFDLTKPGGWTIWRIKVPGWVLEYVLSLGAKNGLFFNTSGSSYEISGQGEGASVSAINVNGQSLDSDRTYDVAVPEGIGRGMKEAARVYRALFRPEDSGVPIWTAVEKKLRELGPVF